MVESSSVLVGANPFQDPLSLFFIQMVFILVFFEIIHRIFRFFKMPRYISDVVSGILIGTSGLCRIPQFKNTIFPDESIVPLRFVSDIGLVLLLFLVGLEIDAEYIIKSFKKSIAVSLAGIAIPFIFAIGITYVLKNGLQPLSSKSFASYVVFVGISMSITAYPVLAQILTQLKIIQTPLGKMALSAAAVDDVFAWLLLVLDVALIKNNSNFLIALYIILITIAYLGILFFFIKPLFKKFLVKREDDKAVSEFSILCVFVVVSMSAFLINAIGVHPMVGSFLAGLVIPHEHGFAIHLSEKIEDLVTIFFMPLFYTSSGLLTDLGYMYDWASWLIVLLVVSGSFIGKLIGCAIASKLTGSTWIEAITLGIFMNTKGLLELVVLNIGFLDDVINERVFVVLVLSSIFSTLLIVPIVRLIYRIPNVRKAAKKNKHLRSPTVLSFKTVQETNLPTISVPDSPISHSFEAASGRLELNILICLTDTKANVSGILKLVKAIAEAPVDTNFCALRLYNLTERNSAIMLATDTENMANSDYILSRFTSFCEVNDIVTRQPIANACAQDEFADFIVKASEDTDSDLVLIPYTPKGMPNSKMDEESLAKMKQLAADMACTLVFYLDRLAYPPGMLSRKSTMKERIKNSVTGSNSQGHQSSIENKSNRPSAINRPRGYSTATSPNRPRLESSATRPRFLSHDRVPEEPIPFLRNLSTIRAHAQLTQLVILYQGTFNDLELLTFSSYLLNNPATEITIVHLHDLTRAHDTTSMNSDNHFTMSVDSGLATFMEENKDKPIHVQNYNMHDENDLQSIEALLVDESVVSGMLVIAFDAYISKWKMFIEEECLMNVCIVYGAIGDDPFSVPHV